jgi:hypothetical protein
VEWPHLRQKSLSGSLDCCAAAKQWIWAIARTYTRRWTKRAMNIIMPSTSRQQKMELGKEKKTSSTRSALESGENRPTAMVVVSQGQDVFKHDANHSRIWPPSYTKGAFRRSHWSDIIWHRFVRRQQNGTIRSIGDAGLNHLIHGAPKMRELQ